MANGFDSAGAGFSRGFASGRQIKANKQAARSEEQAAKTKQFKETLDAAREQSLDTFTQFSDLARQVAERGGTEDEIGEFRRGAQAALATYGQTLEQIRAQATNLGQDGSVVPSGQDFVNQHIGVFDAAVKAGSMMTPGQTGARTAQEKMAEAKAVADEFGVPAERVAAAMGIVPGQNIARVGQRVVKDMGEAEVFLDEDTNELFVQDAEGNRTVLPSDALTTPIERSETGGPGSFDPRTQSQLGEATSNFQSAAVGSSVAIQSAAGLLAIAKESPEALGAPGTILRIGNEFVRTAVSLAQMFPRPENREVAPERNMENFNFENFKGQMRETAIESQAFRSGVFGIAFAAAVADQGTRPTDKDIQAFIDQIGGSTADPEGFARTIKTFVERIDYRLRATARVMKIPADVQEPAFAEIDSALEEFNAFFAQSKPEELEGFGDLTPEEQEELRELMRGN
jgi:hypothetical protein